MTHNMAAPRQLARELDLEGMAGIVMQQDAHRVSLAVIPSEARNLPRPLLSLGDSSLRSE
jgi:hypothetical protein